MVDSIRSSCIVYCVYDYLLKTWLLCVSGLSFQWPVIPSNYQS